MYNTKYKPKLFFLTFLSLFFLLTSCNFPNSLSTIDFKPNPNLLTIHYINVGQGDCELVQINNINLLIDAGPKDSENKVTSYLKCHGVTNLDYVIATHPHEDHIGGLNMVFQNFKVKTFIAPKIELSATTELYKQLLQTIRSKNMCITVAKSGNFINLGKNIKCEILAPNSCHYDDLNNYSVVLKIVYNNTKFLFTGDAQTESEREMLDLGYDLSCNVLKVGHHGSKTATSNNFLKNVSPAIAIISCGKSNPFGHPHKVTLDKLNNIGCKIFRTDLNGDIVLTSDGLIIKKVLP